MTEDENKTINWRHVAKDFVHNTLFSFAIGPFINGMSFAINHNKFWNGVKEVATSWRGWRCNAELALAVGTIGTMVNVLLRRGHLMDDAKTGANAESPGVSREVLPLDGATTSANHAAREEARRDHVTDASISR